MSDAATQRIPLLRDPAPAIAGARLVMAAIVGIYVLTFQAQPGYPAPGFTRLAGVLLVAGLVATSVVQFFDPKAWRFEWTTFVIVDGLITCALVVLYAFDPSKYLFAIAFGVVVEAALTVGLASALITWGALSGFYIVKELYADIALNVPWDPVSLLFRIVILLGIALVVGSLVEAARAMRTVSAEREEIDRLREIDEMKTAFLSAVSHDLKNPLTAILGFSTTLERRLDRLPPERTLEFLGHITRSARRLQAMLGDLLDMERIERGVIQPNLRATDVGDLVRRTVEEIELHGRRVTIDAEDVTINLDASKVERIVENLVTNALKYTPAPTPIELSVAASNGGVLIKVDDEGEGVPDELKEKLFQPFLRAPEAPAKATGSGVGLSLVSRFAELHGGKAWVQDRPGGGASFRVLLPDAEDPDPKE